MTSSQALNLIGEQETLALGKHLAQGLRPGMKLYLSGDLGAGKTTLVRGVLRGLGYGGSVKSPTYTLVELYNLSRLDLHHFDFYRFNHSDEWDDAGFREVFGTEGVCIVEWPEKAQPKLPTPDLSIRLEYTSNGRAVLLTAFSSEGVELFRHLTAFNA